MHRGRGWRVEKRKVSPEGGLGKAMHLGEGIHAWDERWAITHWEIQWIKEAQWRN